MSEDQTPPIAIVGIGCRFPKASGLDQYWANIKSGLDAITDIPDSHWDPADYFDDDKNTPDMTYARRGGFIDPIDFDPLEFGITPKNLEATDTTHLMGLVAARDALRDAGYASGHGKDDGRPFDRDRCSAILGVTGTLELVIPLGARLGHPKWRKALKDAGVDKETAEDVVERIGEQYVSWQENSFPGLLGNVAAGRIANRFDLGGTNCVVDAACASSLSALHLAAMELYTGRSDMAISGGIDTFNDIFMFMCFSKTPALSPTGNSKPFSVDGDGTILGEGVGVVIMKRLEDAQRDHDKIYAVLRGIGSSSDGLGNAIYAPSASGQAKALRNAYRAAQVDPAAVELVEAHGTGTRVGDRIELEALSDVYSENIQQPTWCAIGSVKSMIGHTKAAAGVASLIKATLALRHKVLPPTIKISRPHDVIEPGTAPLYANTIKRPWVKHAGHPRFAALSALGFGGSNFHCVLEEADPIKRDTDWDPAVQFFAWSGVDKQSLRQRLQETLQACADGDMRQLAAATRQRFSQNDAQRLALVSDQAEDIKAGIQRAIEQLDKDERDHWSLPDGIYYSCRNKNGDLAVVFPGQGSQRCGMLRDLACQFPEVLESLDAANAAFGVSTYQERLSDVIYPIPVFDDDAAKAQEAHLRQTQYTQPALGAVSYGSWKALQQFKIKATAFAGHSYGELPALCAAGRIDETALHQLSCKRGALMADGTGDRGSMLAVAGPVDEIEALLNEHDWHIVIANRNAPEQVVLSGATSDIEAAQHILDERFRSRKLDVAAAFHSEFVSDAAKPFRSFLEGIEFHEGNTPVYANKSAQTYPADSTACRALLADQLISPVAFIEEIRAMHAAGINCFLEVGPGNVLSNLIAAILKDEAVDCISIDASKGRKNGVADLGRSLAQLAVAGHELNLQAWDADYQPAPAATSKMSISISGANYRLPYQAKAPAAPRTTVQQTAQSEPAHTATQPPTPAQTQTQTQTQTQAAPAPQAPQAPVQTTQTADAMDPQQQALLQATQASINALQQMQEQTALLHQQYLASQASAQNSITSLLQQQQQLFSGQPISAAPTTVQTPAPAAAVQATAPVAAQPAPAAAPNPAPEPAAAPVAPVAPASSDQQQEISSALLRIVCDKTGYPESMLDINMHLDADLGIDSIKRVEILSALQETIPGLPSIDADQVNQVQTLNDIVIHCADALGEQPQAAAPVASAPAATDNNVIAQDLLHIVAEKTGYPQEMLNLDMDLDADLGIDSIKRVEILSALQEQRPELPSLDADATAAIHKLSDIVSACAALDDTSIATDAVTAATAATGSNNNAAVEECLLQTVADKTGYPLEMLDLDMQLDADLGIDSIKRVEILSAIQEQLPDLPAVEADEMASLLRLRDVFDYLQQQAPAAPAPAAEPATSTSTTASMPAASSGVDVPALTETLLSVVAEKTGYPREMLDINMQLDADLGIDSIKRVEILSALQEQIPHAPVVQADDIAEIQTLKHIIDHICELGSTETGAATESPAVNENETPPSTESVSPTALQRLPLTLEQIDDYRSRLELQRSDQCLIIDDGSGLAELLSSELPCSCSIVMQRQDLPEINKLTACIVLAQQSGSDDDLYQRFLLLQKILPQLEQSQGLCVAICRLGAGFGLHGDSGEAQTAAWSGLIKTVSHEYPAIDCKVIDCNADLPIQRLVEEICFKGPLEVALTADEKWTCSLQRIALPDNDKAPRFDSNDTIVVSGGARGVTAEVAVALAQRYQCRIALLGRSELEGNEAEWLQTCVDEAAVKQALIQHWGSGAPSPKEVNQQCARILVQREIRATLHSIEGAGASVSYHSVDVRDQAAVTACITAIRQQHGAISGIIHGAGVLADRLIADKTLEQFRSVWQTKVDGARNLLAACSDDELKALVFFSSSTARFGRKGQCDYAAANEVLNKMAVAWQAVHPACKTLSINWGPWDGGMVTPALKALFAAEGVAVIDCQLGARYLCDELDADADQVEIVILGDDNDQTTDNETARHEHAATTRQAFSFDLSVATHPFLRSHVMNKRAVLPAAMIMEWMTHAAMHENPGLQFAGMRDLSIFKGVILSGDDAYALQFHISDTKWRDGRGFCSVALQHDDVLHVRAIIELADELDPAQPDTRPLPQGPSLDGNPYQDQRLFHGTDFQGLISVAHCDASGIICDSQPAPAVDQWINKALKRSWYADPLVIDLAFQAMILWSHQLRSSPSLPTRIGRYQQFTTKFPSDGCRIVTRITNSQKHSATADIDFLDHQGTLVARIQAYECVIDPSLAQSFANNQLAEEVSS